MVQLHYDMNSIKVLIENGCKELGPIYCRVLEDLFYDYMGDTRVSSLSTIRVGLDKAWVFLRWLKERGVKPDNIDDRILKRFLVEIKMTRKPGTVFSYVKALKRMLRLLGKEELANKLKYPKQPEKVPDLPSPELVEKIISELRDPFKTIVAIIYETGARVSEILSLKYKHIKETPQGYYKIIIEEPKNKESRTIYVIKYAMLLRNYLLLHPGKPDEIVFKSPVHPEKPLKPRNVELALRRASRKHNTRIYPHLLRHLRATLLIKQGMPERITMKLLGHKTEKMMKIYVNLVQKDIEEAVLKHYGIQPQAQNNGKEATKCPRCGATNPKEANYCWRCAYPLHQQAALELETKEKDIEEKLRKLLKIIEKYPEILRNL